MKKLFFMYSDSSSTTSGIAVETFNAAAKNSNMDWVAEAKRVAEPNEAKNADLKSAELLIGFDKGSQQSLLKLVDPFLPAKAEFWNVPSSSDAAKNFIESEIQKLCVMLILKGGKKASTAPAQTCSSCRQSIAFCVCKKAAVPAQSVKNQNTAAVRVSLDRKGRGGKDVTVITGLPLSDSELEELGRKLKAQCGCGGTTKDGHIELQGDRRDFIMTKLQELGYKPKRTGG